MSTPNVLNDSAWVRSHYATEDRLKIRILTHEIYTQPKVDFPAWILDQITWSGSETVLDLGCGSGAYLAPGRQRCRRFIAGDISMGMLRSLGSGDFGRLNLEATFLPFQDNSVDVILANHMLYHVPNIPAAIAQIGRILKPGGRLLAATNSATSNQELKQLVRSTIIHLGMDWDGTRPGENHDLPFSLENGRSLLGERFTQVERVDLDSALVFPAAEPVLAYVDSTRDIYLPYLPKAVSWSIFLDELYAQLQKLLKKNGGFRVLKQTGVFVCKK